MYSPVCSFSHLNGWVCWVVPTHLAFNLLRMSINPGTDYQDENTFPSSRAKLSILRESHFPVQLIHINRPPSRSLPRDLLFVWLVGRRERRDGLRSMMPCTLTKVPKYRRYYVVGPPPPVAALPLARTEDAALTCLNGLKLQTGHNGRFPSAPRL